MALLTATQVRDHIETDLIDEALERLINDADAEIIRRLGAAATHTDTLLGGDKNVWLTRKATSVTSIVERVRTTAEGVTETTLVSDDYHFLDDGYRIERLPDGTNAQSEWQGEVIVTYVPETETYQRTRLLIDLVRLSVSYHGGAKCKAGDVSIEGPADYQRERDRLFSGLRSQGRRLIA
jgi:hypothetical protein